MRILLTILAILATTTAYAGGNNNTGGNSCQGNCPQSNGGGGPIEITNTNTNTNTNTANASAGAVAGASAVSGSQSIAGGGDAVAVGQGGNSNAINGGNTVQVAGGDTLLDAGDVLVDGGDTHVNVDGADLNVEGSQMSVGSTLVDASSSYRVPAHADAGLAMSMLQGCYGIGGADARGSGSQSAGGLTLNLFKLTNDRCVLNAKALEAQANGNLKGYVTMTCADRAVWKGYRDVTSALEERKVDKGEAIRICVAEMTETALIMSKRVTNIEAKMIEILEGEGYDDEEIRRRLRTLEDVAHLPNKGFLLKDHSD